MSAREARISEWGYLHEDGFDLGASVISFSGIAVFFGGKFAERCGGCVVLDDVAWGNDVFEAVAFGYLSTFLAFAAYD